MLIALGIKEHDATVVEVEGGTCTSVAGYLLPPLWVAPDVFDHHHGLLVAMNHEGLEAIPLVDRNASKLDF
jgi:hypothetical protein